MCIKWKWEEMVQVLKALLFSVFGSDGERRNGLNPS